MNIIPWLLEGDDVINRLTKIYLLDKKVNFINTGLIKSYLDLYVDEDHGWGHGLYSHKWISDHYTLLELKDMEIDPSNIIYLQAVTHLLEGFWYKGPKKNGSKHHQDLCVASMMLGLAAYGKINNYCINEMVDYILGHIMLDGGWNCSWEGQNPSNKSSLHTTLTTLEAFNEYIKNGYSYRLQDIKKSIAPGEEFILKKRLFRSVTNGNIINPNLISFHYPVRWRYDAFRALEYFANVHHPYDSRMDEALSILKEKISKGFVGKGVQYSGLFHFKLETSKGGRFNTLRALKILKYFDFSYYQQIINQDFPKLD